MKTIGEFLKEKRQGRDWSLREAEKHTGVSFVHIKDIENGVKSPSFDIIMKMVKGLGADLVEFLKETGYMPPNVEPARMAAQRQVPLISWVKAGNWQEACDNFQPGDADEWIDTEIKGECVFALRVSGDSMEPEFNEGEIIVVNPHVDANPGDYVVVKNGKGETTLKQLKKYGNTYVLHPLNSRYQDMEVKKGEFQIIGRVAEKKKRY